VDDLIIPPVFELVQAEAIQFLRGLPSDSIDGFITDPPYSSGGQFRGDRMGTTTQKYQLTGVERQYEDFAGDNRDQRGFSFWALLWLGEAFRVMKSGAPICLFCDWRQLPLVTDLMQGAGFTWRGIAVWDKTEGTRPTKGRYRAQCEYIVWGSKGPMPLERGVPVLPGVFRYVVKQADKHHLTGKPTDLMRDIVKIVPAGGLICDSFAGSASTGVGAILEGRHFIGSELGAGNVQIGTTRLEAAQRGEVLSANAERRTKSRSGTAK
jgi:site-specific DNA-methyltransferase (adenine-specific)